MEMPESEPIFVGVAEKEVKQNRTPARLKPTSEPMPIPKTIPTADRFSWDGMGLDPNAESEEQRSRRSAQIKKEVKADLSVYAHSGDNVTKDPRREKTYADGVLKGLGLGPRAQG